ncbi:hypothetical protein ACT7C1_18110 [Bacillus paranthracis]
MLRFIISLKDLEKKSLELYHEQLRCIDDAMAADEIVCAQGSRDDDS